MGKIKAGEKENSQSSKDWLQTTAGLLIGTPEAVLFHTLSARLASDLERLRDSGLVCHSFPRAESVWSPVGLPSTPPLGCRACHLGRQNVGSLTPFIPHLCHWVLGFREALSHQSGAGGKVVVL